MGGNIKSFKFVDDRKSSVASFLDIGGVLVEVSELSSVTLRYLELSTISTVWLWMTMGWWGEGRPIISYFVLKMLWLFSYNVCGWI